MAVRFAMLLPRFVAVAVLGVLATAAVTFAAEKTIVATPKKPAAQAPSAPPAVVVPDVRRQAFVFAKGTLEDSGFAWRVSGSVHGFAANLVAEQSPAPGLRLIDTGAPTITLVLQRNAHYPEHGAPEDASQYGGTAVELADVPAKPAQRVAAKPAKKPLAKRPVAKHLKKAAKPKHTTLRPRAFAVAGAPKEPLDEMTLPARARLLGKWLDTHRQPTRANVQHWLYQHAWIVAGARFGWWHGDEALRILLADDAKVRARWGIGARSEWLARRALAEVEAKSR
jgi:PASTA domain